MRMSARTVAWVEAREVRCTMAHRRCTDLYLTGRQSSSTTIARHDRIRGIEAWLADVLAGRLARVQS
jgi:hypothetical protein